MLLNGGPLNGAPLNGAIASSAEAEPEYIVAGISYLWSLRVVVGGVDMSAQLTGGADVDREEGAAGVAGFQLYLPAGPVVPSEWVGRTVTIDYISTKEGVTTEARRFTGRIAGPPQWDSNNRILSCECSDQLQQRVEALSVAEIDALTCGLWSLDVFDPVEGRSRWDYAQERMSTRTASLDCSPTGELRVTSWYATAPHFVFGYNTTIDESLSVEWPDLSRLVNTVAIESDYRYMRLRQQNEAYSWIGGGFCDWYFSNSKELPTTEMVREAVASAGANLMDNFSWDLLWPTMPDPCGLGVPWENSFVGEELLLGASFTIARRWAQSVTERYALSVQVPTSIAVAGEVIERIGSAFEVESVAAETWADTPFTDGFSSHTDERDDARRALFLQVQLLQAVATVVQAHRGTVLNWQVPTSMVMGIDLVHTILFEDQGARAIGKVVRVADDFGEALPTTTISIKVMRGGGDVTDPLTPPASVDEEQPPPIPTPTNLPTQLGGRVDAPEYDDELPGFAGNYTTTEPSAEMYPRRFDIDAAEIPVEQRDELIVPIDGVYRVAIPNDLLEL
ncbi:MAG: hypothetical protein KJ989_12945 [Gammaproteobacteria bacterium]|uniref:Uncharacterized protein n=1 Tax=viral metagenome TaxID=1070528 RepID=A0A6M3KGL4_9ZZZZ|nr:hypothetical protein [Gammaproteobacteria bacterium]MBU2157122.1 hypothetical protein [Gammaproteobacteria bacterium]MBU2256036.1 hypothetical protein [Gammaproteobacteria bacterium]MBU2295104.1 hypothetical protein [Gammaproteobacteria bacterium]